MDSFPHYVNEGIFLTKLLYSGGETSAGCTTSLPITWKVIH